jgi:hypothetical protein
MGFEGNKEGSMKRSFKGLILMKVSLWQGLTKLRPNARELI